MILLFFYTCVPVLVTCDMALFCLKDFADHRYSLDVCAMIWYVLTSWFHVGVVARCYVLHLRQDGQ